MKYDGKILAVDTGLTSCKALIFSLDGEAQVFQDTAMACTLLIRMAFRSEQL